MGRGGGGGGGGKGGGGRTGRKAGGIGGAGPQSEEMLQRHALGQATGSEVIEVRTDAYGRSIEVTRDIAEAERLAQNDLARQGLSAYDDLAPVTNANRIVDRGGNVHVGDLGAPKVTRKLSNDAAMKRFEELGLPRGRAYENLKASGDASALIELLPAGSKYLGSGVEGVGFSLPGAGHRALRIQHGGGIPLNQIDVGKTGVYADWMGKYGKTFVEQKEAMAMQGWAIGQGKKINKVQPFGKEFGANKLQSKMEGNMALEGKKVHGVDNHSGNWGIDYKGRARVFDAGAYRPIGDNKVAAIWESGGNAVKQKFKYRDLSK